MSRALTYHLVKKLVTVTLFFALMNFSTCKFVLTDIVRGLIRLYITDGELFWTSKTPEGRSATLRVQGFIFPFFLFLFFTRVLKI